MDPDLFLQFKMERYKEKFDADKAVEKTSPSTKGVEKLEAELEFLSLMCRSLLEVLMENKLCTKSSMTDIMKRLDMLDGELDGKLDTQVLIDELGTKQPKVDDEKA
jgi:hypothetical protein